MWHSSHFWIIYLCPQTRSAVFWSDRELRFWRQMCRRPRDLSVILPLLHISILQCFCPQRLPWLKWCRALLHCLQTIQAQKTEFQVMRRDTCLRTDSGLPERSEWLKWTFCSPLLVTGVKQEEKQLFISFAVHQLKVRSRHSANSSTHLDALSADAILWLFFYQYNQ